MDLSHVPERSSIDYLLRTTQQHHVQLSAMADQKANIIVAFSSVVFTVSLTQIGAARLVWGFVALAAASSLALLMAILSLLPRFERRRNQRVDVPPNLLFFGHFTEFTEEEYLERMAGIMSEDGSAYAAILRDIYQIGQVLRKKKYRYLGLSYRFFLWGVLGALAVFVVEIAVAL